MNECTVSTTARFWSHKTLACRYCGACHARYIHVMPKLAHFGNRHFSTNDGMSIKPKLAETLKQRSCSVGLLITERLGTRLVPYLPKMEQ